MSTGTGENEGPPQKHQQSQLPKVIHRLSYTKPKFNVPKTYLYFQLEPARTRVRARYQLTRTTEQVENLELHGEAMKLLRVSIDDRALNFEQFEVTPKSLVIAKQHLPAAKSFWLEVEVEISPETNTSLAGLYMSDGCFTTQCEAESFRRIVYSIDRPDVMSEFWVSIEAQQENFPVLLSNGARVEGNPGFSFAPLEPGMHRASFHDPFLKPTYLFALVAGRLACWSGNYTTRSGRKIELEFYTQPGKETRCEFAMESLKRAMRWDEERFGLEIDLDRYVVVAMDSFNAGAMENKGLNIFNSALLLADQRLATDSDLYNIESVMAHEYFHNWTGNRVTLRDWFELSLKEGLTVFRDQEFSMDQGSRGAVRVSDIADLRRGQFVEDEGPNSHPIRPDECLAVDNLFTATIYSKGAEVVRMMQTLVGRPGFRKGMDLYIQRHDGQAVTIDDFAKAIADANSQALSMESWEQFRRWYIQPGLPHVEVSTSWNPTEKTKTLRLRQSIPSQNKPTQDLFIPVRAEVLGGTFLASHSDWSSTFIRNSENQLLLLLREKEQSWIIQSQSLDEPVVSLLQDFSAPIQLNWERSTQELVQTARADDNQVVRYDAIQEILLRELVKEVVGETSSQRDRDDRDFLAAMSVLGFLLTEANTQALESIDGQWLAEALRMPSEKAVLTRLKFFEPEKILAAQLRLQARIAQSLQGSLLSLLQRLQTQLRSGSAISSIGSKSSLHHAWGLRALKNRCLHWLMGLPQHLSLAEKVLSDADNMTDEMAALMALSSFDASARLGKSESHHFVRAAEKFYQRWAHETLLVNKWFSLMSSYPSPGALDRFQSLLQHKQCNWKVPNVLYSVGGGFLQNPWGPYGPEKEALPAFLDFVLKADAINPNVASRMMDSLELLPRLVPARKERALALVEELLKKPLSENTREPGEKLLKGLR